MPMDINRLNHMLPDAQYQADKTSSKLIRKDSLKNEGS